MQQLTENIQPVDAPVERACSRSWQTARVQKEQRQCVLCRWRTTSSTQNQQYPVNQEGTQYKKISFFTIIAFFLIGFPYFLTIFLPKYPGFTLVLNVFLFTLAENGKARQKKVIRINGCKFFKQILSQD